MKRGEKAKGALANRRGVFSPFNYRATKNLAAILVCRDVEKTSEALLKSIKGKAWQKDVYGKSVHVEGAFYNPFQLRGHSWTTIIDLLRFDDPPFSASLAQALSAELKTKTIFFSYQGTSSIALLVLFQNGELSEVLVNDGSTSLEVLSHSQVLKRQQTGWPAGFYFYSRSRKLKIGELEQKAFEGFVDKFFRLHDAWLAFDGASSVADGMATFSLSEGDREDVQRVDLVALHPARSLTKSQIRDESAAKSEAELSNQSFAMARAPRSDVGSSWTASNRKQAIGLHRKNLAKLKRLIKKGARADSYELWQAAKCDNVELAKVLIEGRADLNACPHGSTALATAIERRNVGMALLLVQAGANPNQKGKWSAPPLLLATATRQTEVVRALIGARADVNIKGDVSCGENNETLERVLAGRSSAAIELASAPFAEDSTALVVAVRCGYLELVRLLLIAGADDSIPDKDGMTAMDWAKRLKDERAVALLELGNA